jgi:transposase
LNRNARVNKARAMRKQRLKRYLARRKKLKAQRPRYDTLLTKIGAAKQLAGRAARLVTRRLPTQPEKNARVNFDYALNRTKLRQVRRREGRYLLRSNLTGTDPAKLGEFYLQLTQIEAAFKTLKSDLTIRPIYHQRLDRIEAHIFIAFLAYCLQVTLTMQLKPHAPGLTARSALQTLAAMQLIDVHFPTTDGRELIFTRHTEREPAQ